MPPDSKPPPRIVDRNALRKARLMGDECAACQRPPANVHHVIPRGEGGDDVPGNLLLICGSGTSECHGALHGSPYIASVTRNGVLVGERRSAEWVRRRMGEYMLERRPDCIRYVLEKLGEEPGRAYLLRVYYCSVPDDDGDD